MSAQDETPASDPHKNGTRELCTGIQAGVGPCSPDGSRPMICLKPSYSKKYKAVPRVSLTSYGLPSDSQTRNGEKQRWAYDSVDGIRYIIRGFRWRCTSPARLA